MTGKNETGGLIIVLTHYRLISETKPIINRGKKQKKTFRQQPDVRGKNDCLLLFSLTTFLQRFESFPKEQVENLTFEYLVLL